MKLIGKRELKEALGVTSTRIIDSWMRRKMIPFFRLGHRTVKFSLPRVLEALDRFEIKAVGGRKQ